MAEEKQTTDYRKMAMGDPEEAGAAPIATDWITANRGVVDAATTPSALDVFIASKESATELLARAKSGYQTDALDAIRIAAVTQQVMTPPVRESQRRLWSEALIAAIAKTSDVQLIMFYLDQFRWCGFKDQLAALETTASRVDNANLKAFIRQIKREI